MSDQNPKDEAGKKKPDTTLVPASSIIHEATAFMDGARKYGPYNWRKTAVSAMVYLGAADRHLRSFIDGEDYDPITGIHHLAYVKANCGIILDGMELEIMVDDRPPKGKAATLIRRFQLQGNLRPVPNSHVDEKDVLISKLMVKLTSFAMAVDNTMSYCKICHTTTTFANSTLQLPHAHEKTCIFYSGDQ